MKKRIEQLLEVSCMVLTSVANINCKCRTYKNNLLHATWNKMGVIDNTCVFSRFCKLRKETINFVMSVRLSVHMERVGFHWVDFHEIFYFSIFR